MSFRSLVLSQVIIRMVRVPSRPGIVYKDFHRYKVTIWVEGAIFALRPGFDLTVPNLTIYDNHSIYSDLYFGRD